MKLYASMSPMPSDLRMRPTVAWARRLLIGWGLATLAMAPAAACTVSAEALVFGPIDPLAAQPTDTVASLEVTCPVSTGYSVSINHRGDGQRQMLDGSGNPLIYGLYTDASFTMVWGDGTGGTQPVAGEAGPEGITHEIHGRVPAQPYSIPGLYADTLLITVTY